MQDYRILRHVTNKGFLDSIISDGALKGDYSRRKGDNNYISFELNPTNDTLVSVFHILKDWDIYAPFELQFDGEQLIEAGYEIHTTIDGKSFIKEEIDMVMEAKGERKVSHEIGDYVFIKDIVPLKFLTSYTKKEIENWAQKNNLNEDEVIRVLSIE